MTDQTAFPSRGETDAEREHRRSRLSSMLDDLQNAIPAGGRWDVRMSAERRMALMAFIRGEIESLASEKEAPPDVLGQVETALRKNPLIAQFLDQGFWHAHHVDVLIRFNGQDKRFEADWIKDLWYIVRRRGLSTVQAIRAEQQSSGQGGEANAQRIP